MVMSRLDKVQNWPELAKQAGFRAGFLSQLVGISARQLRRYARNHFGQNLQNWLNAQRLILAAEILKDCDSIKRLAGELGYKDCSHFCHQFKHRYGMSPTKFLAGNKPLNLILPAKKCPNVRHRQ
jgi:AraC-like DNA-binding protein